MSLKDIVTVTISSDGPPLTRAGFGTPMVLAFHTEWSERVRYYEDMDGVGEDFDPSSPVYRCLNAMFAQSPRPPRIAVGRRALAPTQAVTITPTAADATKYTVTIDGTEFTFTSGESADEEDVATGLAGAINGGSLDVTASVTGSGSAATLEIEADNAGDWFSFSVGSLLSLVTDNADPGVTSDLTAISNENDDWYAVYSISRSKAEVASIAAWVESRGKLFAFDSNDSDILGSGTTDIFSTLKASSYFRVLPMFKRTPGDFAAAAWLARVLPLDPGSETWAFKTLAGVSSDFLTATEKQNILGKNGNAYYSIAGRNVTREGRVSSGEWVDVVRGRDWLEARLSEDTAEVIVNAEKLPYTDAGAEVVRSTVQARLNNGVSVGLLADDPAPVATVPRVAEVPTADRRARRLPAVKFQARLAGAIHAVEINGSVSV